jgi:hypothetical protein
LTDTIEENVPSCIYAAENLPAHASDLVERAARKVVTDHENPYNVGRWLANKLKRMGIASDDAYYAMMTFAGSVSCLENCSLETIHNEFYSAFPDMPRPEYPRDGNGDAPQACDLAVPGDTPSDAVADQCPTDQGDGDAPLACDSTVPGDVDQSQLLLPDSGA